MSFGQALGFPFKGENIPKILNFILIYIIITASVMVVGLLVGAFEWALVVSGFIALGYASFVSGYMIEVIRSIMDGNEILPPSDLGRDLMRGLAVFFASLIHVIPLIMIFACVFVSMGAGMSMNDFGRSSDGGALMMLCGAMIVAVIIGYFVGNALLVGMVRYAAEDRSGAMFEFGTNLGYVTSNTGAFMGLFLRSFGIGIIYAILSGIVSGMFRTTEALTPYGYTDVGFGLMAFFVIESVLTQSLSLMSQFSVAHLQARLGNQLGISGDKPKPKNDDYQF